MIIKARASSKMLDGFGIQDGLSINLYSKRALALHARSTESQRHRALPPRE